MKKFMMTLAVLMMAVVSANAQHEPGTFCIQPKAGIGLSWLSNAGDLNIGGAEYDIPNVKLDKSVTFAGMIGAEAEYQITDMFSVAAGLNFSLQGTGWSNKTIRTTEGEFDIKDTRIQLCYFNIPVVANVYVFKGFAVKAGVQVGFLTSANTKATLKGNSRQVDIDRSISDECKKVDFSIPVGVSYEFSTPIVVDLRYNIGVTKVNKVGESMRNNVIMATVGYKFEL